MKGQTSLDNNNNKSKIPCDGCKGHHIRCDRDLAGCKNCIRRGIECTYLITRKRRGPKTKVESMMKLFESLNNTAKKSEVLKSANTTTDKNIPAVLVENQINQKLEPQLSVASSPMQTTPVSSVNLCEYQTNPQALTVYQDIYSLPIPNTNIYSFTPFPAGLASFEPSLIFPIQYNQLTMYPQLPYSQLIENLDPSSTQYSITTTEPFQNSFYY